MTKEEILHTFSDINYYYNNSTKHDTLKRMLDELSELCEDCISRAEAIKAVREAYSIYIPRMNGWENGLPLKIDKAIYDLPGIQPKPKTAKWQHVIDGHWVYEKCLSCGSLQDVKSNYCPNCGAQMEDSENGKII